MSDEHTHRQAASGDVARQRRNARYGLLLFVVYVALYGGFIALNIADPLGMARPAWGGVNLAIGFGFVLIVAAFSLALVYMMLCRRPLPGSGAAPGAADAGTAPAPGAATGERP